MRGSFATTLIWIANVGVLAGGIGAIFVLKSDGSESSAKADAALKKYIDAPVDGVDLSKHVQAPESWQDLRRNSGTSIEFANTALVFGPPDKVTVIDNGKPGPVGPPPPPDWNAQLQTEIEVAKRALTEKVFVDGMMYSEQMPELSQAFLRIKGKPLATKSKPNPEETEFLVTVMEGMDLRNHHMAARMQSLPIETIRVKRILFGEVIFACTTAKYISLLAREGVDLERFGPEIDVVLKQDKLDLRNRDEVNLESLNDLATEMGVAGKAFENKLTSDAGSLAGAVDAPPGKPVEMAPSTANPFEGWPETTKWGENEIELGSDVGAGGLDEILGVLQVDTNPQNGETYLRVTDKLPEDVNHVARRAGIQAGDQLISVNGKPAKTPAEVKAIVIPARKAGETKFVAKIMRNGQVIEKSVTLPKKKGT